jgi:hypothetical protein
MKLLVNCILAKHRNRRPMALHTDTGPSVSMMSCDLRSGSTGLSAIPFMATASVLPLRVYFVFNDFRVLRGIAHRNIPCHTPRLLCRPMAERYHRLRSVQGGTAHPGFRRGQSISKVNSLWTISKLAYFLAVPSNR